MDGGEQHAAGVNAHHGTRREVGDGDERLADKHLRLIEGVNAGENGARRAGAVIQRKLQQLLRLRHSLAGKHLDRAEIRPREGVKIHEIRKQRLNLHLGEVNLFRGCGRRLRRCLRLLLRLGRVQRLHCRDFRDQP